METLDIFLIRNDDQLFYKSFDWNRINWTKNVKEAKIYDKLSTARRRVTILANLKKPESAVILKMTAALTEVLDEKERVKKYQENKAFKNQKRAIYTAEEKLKNAQLELEQAKDKFLKIKEQFDGLERF